MEPLVKNLFRTFIIATAIGIGVNCAYFVYKMQGTQYNRQDAATQIAGATLLLTVILAIMSLPVLFLLNPRYWNMIWLRVLLYFSGSIVFLLATFIIKSNSSDQIFELMTGGIFLLIHSIYYIVLTRKHKKKVRK